MNDKLNGGAAVGSSAVLGAVLLVWLCKENVPVKVFMLLLGLQISKHLIELRYRVVNARYTVEICLLDFLLTHPKLLNAALEIADCGVSVLHVFHKSRGATAPNEQKLSHREDGV